MHTVKTKKAKKGFSLLEVLITAFIFSIGLIGMVGLIIASLNESRGARNEIVGASLAQESIEVMKNLRDNNIAAGQLSFYNIPVGVYCPDAYYEVGASGVQVDSQTCPGDGSGKLYLNSDDKFTYTSASAKTSAFSRKVYVSPGPGGGDVTVTSVVVWGTTQIDSVGGAAPSVDCNVSNDCIMVKSIMKTNWNW